MDGTRRNFLKTAVTAAGEQRLPVLLKPKVTARPTATRTRLSLRTSHCESSRLNHSSWRRASSIAPPSTRL